MHLKIVRSFSMDTQSTVKQQTKGRKMLEIKVQEGKYIQMRIWKKA